MMNLNTRILSLCLAAGLSIVFGCTPTEATKSNAPADRASATSNDRVTAGPPIRKTLQLFTVQPGRVNAFEEAPLVPKLPGYIEKVLVDIGDRVQKGQMLIELSIPELKDDLEQKHGLLAQAQAEVRQAEAALVAMKASANSANAMVSQSEASVGRVEGEYKRWTSESQRIQQLVSSGSVTAKLADETLSQFRSAEAAMKEATAMIESAKAGMLEAEANILKADADVSAAVARVRVAQSNVDAATTMITYTRILAPFDGVITNRNVDTGHFVQPANSGASKPLLIVASVDRVRISVDVPEMEAAMIDAGDSDKLFGNVATVRVQSISNKVFDGHISRSSWSLDSQNRSLRTEIDLSNDNQALLPGSYASVSILLAQRNDVLTLPTTAIIREGMDAFCFIVNGGKLTKRPVQIGLRSGNEVEISTGLEGTESVVMVNVGSLRDGQLVDVIATK